MVRLIDADALPVCTVYCVDEAGFSAKIDVVYKEDIDKARAIEPVLLRELEPEKRGRWIFKNNPITDPKGYFIRIVCSECNLHTGQKSNYCPNCGAKMDKEE